MAPGTHFSLCSFPCIELPQDSEQGRWQQDCGRHWASGHPTGCRSCPSLAEESSLPCFPQQQSCLFLSHRFSKWKRILISLWSWPWEEALQMHLKASWPDVPPQKNSHRPCCLPVTLYLAYKNHPKLGIYSQNHSIERMQHATHGGDSAFQPPVTQLRGFVAWPELAWWAAGDALRSNLISFINVKPCFCLSCPSEFKKAAPVSEAAQVLAELAHQSECAGVECQWEH